MQRFIGSAETINYMDTQLNATSTMLKAILDDPEGYGAHVRRYEMLSIFLKHIYLAYLVHLAFRVVLSC